MKTTIFLAIWLAIGFGIESVYWIDRATSAEHVNRRVAALESQTQFLEGVFVACLNHDVFFIQNAVYTCRARKSSLTKGDIKEELNDTL